MQTCIPLPGASCFEASIVVAGEAVISVRHGGDMYEKSRLPAIAASESVTSLILDDFRLRTVSKFRIEAEAIPPLALDWLCVAMLGRPRCHPPRFAATPTILILRCCIGDPHFRSPISAGHTATYSLPAATVCFVPAGHEMLVRCPEGEQRVLVCRFDPEMLRANFDWEWTALELASCFDINNIKIRASLSRIAEEVLHPGFAADVVIDSALSTLMVDLHRHFCATQNAAPDSVAGSPPKSGAFLRK